MKAINKLIDIIGEGIKNEKVPEHKLSTIIEDYIIDNFWEMDKENHDLAIFFNDDVLDICEQTESGLEGTNFRKEIQEAYDKLLEMIK